MRIVNGELDHVPEQAFYLKGTIDDVLEEAKRLEAQGAAAATA